MLFPQISSMFKWVNNFFPGAPSGNQDFVQLIRASDGTILGWIDSDGLPQGSLLQTTPLKVHNGEIVFFTSYTGYLSDVPNNTIFILAKNGQLLLGGGVDYTLSGYTVILQVEALVTDVFACWYTY